MQPVINLPPETSTVNYESQDEKDDSELQLLWHKVIDQGNYQNSTIYTKVEVLILSWAESCDDLNTKEEVDRLRSTFEKKFKYNTQIEYLDTAVERRLQVRLNSIMAGFVGRCDGPNTLLIVYYAGHARPAENFGALEIFGNSLINDQHKRQDVLVWNKTENLLLSAESDVLEIFDCCYAGQMGVSTKGPRSFDYPAASRPFEYLAATDAMGSTPAPGPYSFTSALIYALETLVEEKEGGPFTTIEVLNKIKHNAPCFPKDQSPVLSSREGGSSRGCRIMLRPLHKEGSDIEQPQIRASSLDQDRNNHLNVPSTAGAAFLDQLKRSTVTLHFDFREKPSPATLETLGRGLNGILKDDHIRGISRVRWGGIRQSMVARAVNAFQAQLYRNRGARVTLAGSNLTGTKLMSIRDKLEDDDNMSDISSASTMIEGSPDRAGNYSYRRADLESEFSHNEYRDNSTQTYQSEDQPGNLSQHTVERKKASKALTFHIHRLYAWLYTSSVCSSFFDNRTRHQEPPLDEGKVRVRWTCQCGKRLWDDFVELRAGAAEDLRKDLECFEYNVLRKPQSYANSAEGTSAIQEPPAAHLPPDSSSSAISTGVPTTPSSSDNSPSAVIAARGTSSSESTLRSPRDKFLLLCFSKTNDTLRVSQFRVQHITNDFQLFRMLQDVYAAYRGTFARLFSPRKIVSLNFRKLERHPCDRAVILPSSDIVPQRSNPGACHKDHSQCDTTYDIHPSPPDLDPYIGRNGLAHLLHCPHEAEERGNNLPLQNVWLNRFPKKEKTKLTVCPPYQFGLGWGVELEEGWHVSWLMKIIVATFVLAAAIF